MSLDIFKHKDIPLYVVDIPYGWNDFHTEYFTRIPWGEYKRIRFAERVQSIPPYELKIKIFRDYTVRTPAWTEKAINALPAGIVETVADLIMYVSDSGIIPDTQGKINIPAFVTRLNMYRSIASTNVEYQMYTVICLVFRAYTYEMLDKLPFDRIASLFASAERYLLENGILKAPLQIYDPNEVKNNPENPQPPKPQQPNKKQSEEGSMLEEFLLLKEKQKNQEKLNSKVDLSPDVDMSIIEKKAKMAKAEVKDTSYIAPKDDVVVSNGIQVKVPGISIDNTNTFGGFEEKDFQGPFMTDEEATNLMIESGNVPAGYELYLAKQERLKELEEKQKEDALPNKLKHKKRFKRK